MTEDEINNKRWAELVESGVINSDLGSFCFRGKGQVSRDLAMEIGRLCDCTIEFCETYLARATEFIAQLLPIRPDLTAEVSFDWDNLWSGDERDTPALTVYLSLSETEWSVLYIGEQCYQFSISQYDDPDRDPRSFDPLDISDVKKWLELNTARDLFFEEMDGRPERDFTLVPAPPNPHPEKPER